MGTSLQVFPATTTVPSFGDVLATATRLLHEFLVRHDIAIRPTYQVYWRRGQIIGDRIAPAETFSWSSERCAWFTLNNTPGGTDVYCHDQAEPNRRYLENELAAGGAFANHHQHTHACMTVARRWEFCRWASAAALTNVSYGILAASAASLTDGLLHSDDRAWEYERFPATAAHFLTWWHDPELASGRLYRTWAAKCIRAIREGIVNPNDVEP
jgi:hypothetical protein